MKAFFTLLLVLSLCACGSGGGGGGSSTPPVDPPVVVDPVPLTPGGYTGATLQVQVSTGDAAGNWVGIYHSAGQYSCTNNNADVPLIEVDPDGEGWLGYGLFRVDGAHSEYWKLTITEHEDGLLLDIDLYRGPSSAEPSTYSAHPSNASRFTAVLVIASAG